MPFVIGDVIVVKKGWIKINYIKSDERVVFLVVYPVDPALVFLLSTLKAVLQIN